jgi:EAL domain-containing protein (putative c-di-GMP-specific phosphodiesterase class I)
VPDFRGVASARASVCVQLGDLHGEVDPEYSVAVNISISYLSSGRVVADVLAVLGRKGLPGRALTFEISETDLPGDVTAVARALNELRALGVRVALDGLGAGQASLTSLRTLPVDIVKINGSVVGEVGRRPEADMLVGATVNAARRLGFDCVAEGVEAPGRVAQLRAYQ